ncbi:hypothetical protein OOZ54_12730 [Rhodopseudomonas palustris]|uniref:hypothetical protein n=1 Tax=Rhodopseudomonas palustris TaxID=1076 RepID=UPI0022F0FE91|nr:hypothetical protein [Rhodopseudomonas palustris]WBU27560.1 hypothetical protein OOZ54_12730 [Rhodopseudomonas palustris]
MSREVRRVPATWAHPRDRQGRFIPLRGDNYAAAAAAWDEGARQWAAGMVATNDSRPGAPAWRPRDGFTVSRSYEDFAGLRPIAAAFMPDWQPEERTHWQMYESSSHGTPLSPPLPSTAELASWLADHHASIGPGLTASAAEWLKLIEHGYGVTFSFDERANPVSLLAPPPDYGRFPRIRRLIRRWTGRR